MSNIIYAAMIWMALHGQPENMSNAKIVRSGEVYTIAGWTANCPKPTIDQLRALQAQADAKAAEVEAQPVDVQIGKTVLRTWPDGAVELVSGPLIVPGTTNGAYEVWVDSQTGMLFADLDHASPRRTKAEKDAAKEARKAKIAAVKAAGTDKAKLDALLNLFGLK
jgi:hypothetical protein